MRYPQYAFQIVFAAQRTLWCIPVYVFFSQVSGYQILHFIELERWERRRTLLSFPLQWCQNPNFEWQKTLNCSRKRATDFAHSHILLLLHLGLWGWGFLWSCTLKTDDFTFSASASFLLSLIFIRVRCVGLHVFLLFSIVPCFHNLIMLKLFQWSAKTPMKTTPPVGEIIANTRQYLVETIAYVFQEKEDTPFFEQAVSSAVGFILFTYLSTCSNCST